MHTFFLRIYSITCIGLFLFSSICLAQPSVDVTIDWQSFLSRHDLVWDDFNHKDSRGFYASAQIGNGLLGLAIFAEEDNDGDMIFEVGRKDVFDTRDPADYDNYKNPIMVAMPRLPIGYFKLNPVGTVLSNTMRVDLWNAEARGEIETSDGTIRWRAFSHAENDWMAVDIETTGEERDCTFEYTARNSKNPQFFRFPKKEQPGYEPNPPVIPMLIDGVDVSVQTLLAGGEYATAWTMVEPEPDLRRYYIHTAYARVGEQPRQDAADVINALVDPAFDFNVALAAHRGWWHVFWPGSFISLADPKVESNYYIQLYRFASATRPGKPMIDLLDCWYTETNWPGIWWDLNTQLSYEWIPASGRLFLHESLNEALIANQDSLEANAPGNDTMSIGYPTSYDLRRDGRRRLGCFHWVMRSCWLWYRMHMNDEELRNWIYPLMVKGANHAVQNFLRQDADGVYHTSNSQNPEHKGGPDCTFALANIRWLLQTLIESANRLDIDEPQLPIWQDILDNLVPYHTHENDGLMISETSRLERAHRHFSHLFPLYYGLLNFNEVSQRNLGNKSLEHFLTVGGPGGDRTGYTFGAASAMFSRLNRPEEAYEHLRYLVLTVFKPNATYREGGGPVSETAYASAGWTQELFLQQQGAAIALFPGFPPSEPDAVFHNLAAEGAFRVSAVRDGGSTAWVHVRSLAGEPCVVRGNFQGTPGITGSDGVGLEALGGNTWRVTGLEEGEWALLYRGATPPTNPTVSPLDGSVDEYNYFGSDRAKDTNVPVYPEVNIRTGSGATVNF